MSQKAVPCVVYRGGTSRGLFFHKRDLPEDAAAIKQIFFTGIDVYNLSQVNGLGGTTSSTSKVCVISPSSQQGAEVDWTFYQLGVGVEVADDKGTCGNLMSAAGAFAIDEGLVAVDPDAEKTIVNVYNTNINKILRMEIPVIGGKARVSGDYAMPGVVKPGAMIRVSIVNPGGEKTGKTLPLGSELTVSTPRASYAATLCDLINPFVYVASQDVGLVGTEASSEVASNQVLLDELNLIRDNTAVLAGMAKSVEDAKNNSPAVPKISMVAPPQDYVTTTGEFIKSGDVDILVKVLSMGRLHRTSPASGLYNLAAATLLPGTIPNRISRIARGVKEQVIRIGHPEGVVEVRVTLTDDMNGVAGVGMDRTARRIMKGELFVPVE
ncbi:MAG: PrpF domain-containing protein [Negativicutes bacterium]